MENLEQAKKVKTNKEVNDIQATIKDQKSKKVVEASTINMKEVKKYGIYLKHYTKKFNKFLAVSDLSFKVNHGKIHGFIGPNGAGKTTTIKALIGAFKQTSGQIFVEGYKAGSVSAKKRIGYIPERASFPGHLTCMEYLVTMGNLSGFSQRESKKRAKEILQDLNLVKHQHRKPIEFSSGMKKKILIAQAMMLNPSVLILDEPAANLDPSARKELFDKIKKFRNENKTILISSHILSELQDIVDEVTFIVQGKIKFSGSIKEMSKKSGAIIKFGDEKSTKVKQLITKFNIKEGRGNHRFDAKNEKEVYDLLLEIAKNKIEMQNFSSLKSNLNIVYEDLVGIHGDESGVNPTEKPKPKPTTKVEGE